MLRALDIRIMLTGYPVPLYFPRFTSRYLLCDSSFEISSGWQTRVKNNSTHIHIVILGADIVTNDYFTNIFCVEEIRINTNSRNPTKTVSLHLVYYPFVSVFCTHCLFRAYKNPLCASNTRERKIRARLSVKAIPVQIPMPIGFTQATNKRHDDKSDLLGDRLNKETRRIIVRTP